jgi:hypothetical protein
MTEVGGKEAPQETGIAMIVINVGGLIQDDLLQGHECDCTNITMSQTLQSSYIASLTT